MLDRDLVLLVGAGREAGRASPVRDHLVAEGHAVEEARTAAEARVALERTPVAVALIDLDLPDVEGVTFAREVLEQEPGPDVVIVTARETMEAALAAVQWRAAGSLPRPLDPERVSGLVARICERRRLARRTATELAELAGSLCQAEALLAVSSAVGSTPDLTEALRRICRELARMLDADTASVYLHDPVSDALVPTAAYRVPPEHLETLARATLPLGEQGFRASTWEQRSPVHSDDVSRDPRLNHELFRRVPHQSGLLLPLVLGEEVAGAFYLVWWTRRRVLTPRELERLDTVRDQVALVLRNARLRAESQRAESRLAAQNEVIRRLAAVHRTQEILDLIVHEAPRLLGVQAAGIRLLEGDGLVVAARTEAAAGAMARPRLVAGSALSWLVLSSGQPLAVPDLLGDEHLRVQAQDLVDAGYRGFLGVPLRVAGRVVGSLNLYAESPRRFRVDEVAFLETFADQASLAIARSDLLRHAEEGREVLRQLSRITLALQRAHEVQEQLPIFTAAVSEIVGFDRVFLLLASPDGTRLEAAAHRGVATLPGLTLPLTAAAGPFYQAFRTRRVVAALSDEDLHAVLPLDAGLSGYRELRSRRFVAVPLVVGERALGVAVVDNKPSRRRIPPESIEPLGLLCQQLAAAIEEARLRAEARTRAVEATRLYEITRQLASDLSMDSVLDAIARGALEILGCDAASVMRWDERRGGLTILRSVNLPAPLVEQFVLKPGVGVAGRAFAERRPVWTTDRLADSLNYPPDQAELVATHSPRAYLAAPIISRGEVLGVVLDFYFTPHDFPPEEVRLIAALADQAAIALRNARLYEEAEAQRTQLAQILDSTSDGMVLVARDGQIQAANSRAGEIFGFDPVEVVGADLQALLAGYGSSLADYDRAAAALAAVLRDPDRGAQGDLELRHLGRIVHWAARPATDGAGSMIGFTLTFRDVTEEREVSQMKTDFVSFVTHQLRTPLSGIKWMLELAEGEAGVPAEARSYLQDAAAAAQRLITLVNDLLDVARFEQGRMKVVTGPVDVGELTRAVTADVAGLIREKEQHLSVTGTQDLPPVAADPRLLRQAILNLVSNAIKYTPAGGRLAIHAETDGTALRWAVHDSGIGVPVGARARLFEKFYRADNVAAVETEGTGLGLYLVRLIVEQFGGRVWCESQEGRGSTFAFTIPLKG